MAKSAETYIEQNDFEGAKERLENANGRWKSHWFETCEIIFNSCSKWAKKYILDPVRKIILVNCNNIVARLKNKDIDFSDDCIIHNNDDGVEKCYLIEFFDIKDISVCSKVGTTIRTIQKRIREELNSDTYKKMGAVRCLIHRVYDCKDIPAEGLESRFRSEYIRKYPQSFQKNDRFIKQKFDFAEADRIYEDYFAMA